MLKSIVRNSKVKDSEKGANNKFDKTVSDYRKDVKNLVTDLDLVEKLTQKTTQELKELALELLYLGSIEIGYLARSMSNNGSSKRSSKQLTILEISDGMHNLPNLIAYVEKDNVKHPYYVRANLELEIMKCIDALILNLMIEKGLSGIGVIDDFLTKYFGKG